MADAHVRVCRTDDKGVFFRAEKIMRVRVHRCREEATQMLRLIVRARPDVYCGPEVRVIACSVTRAGSVGP